MLVKTMTDFLAVCGHYQLKHKPAQIRSHWANRARYNLIPNAYKNDLKTLDRPGLTAGYQFAWREV